MGRYSLRDIIEQQQRLRPKERKLCATSALRWALQVIRGDAALATCSTLWPTMLSGVCVLQAAHMLASAVCIALGHKYRWAPTVSRCIAWPGLSGMQAVRQLCFTH